MPLPGSVMRAAHRLRLGLLALRRPLTLGVRVLVRDADGRVLLIRHSYVPGWHMPGGGVGKGESASAAGLRELREEAGITAEGPLRVLSLHARLRPWASDHVAVLAAERWSGTPKPDGVEVVEAAFFAPDALPPDTSPATRRRLAEILGGAAPAEHW